MSELYLITGPAGVGKSTISNSLANSISKSALIEGDDIYNLIKGGYISPWKDGNHLTVFWKNVFVLIDNFLSDGYDVIFNYIIDKDDLEIIKKRFKDYNIKFALLMADEGTLIKRDKMREPDCQMGARCLVLLNKFKEQEFNSNNIIDTSNLTEKEIIKIIKEENLYI
jgi:predicted ABC-type ATPase